LALWQVQKALVGVVDNLPNRLAALFARVLIFPFGARLRPPHDAVGAELARGLLEGGPMRLRLTRDIFIPDASEEGLGRLEATLDLVVAARKVQDKIRDAVRHNMLVAEPEPMLLERAVAGGIISADERKTVDLAAQAQDAAIQVDAFPAATYASLRG
jgi:acyl-CoA dehydrogenase